MVLTKRDGNYESQKISAIFNNGPAECFQVTIDSGTTITGTAPHRLCLHNGLWRPISELVIGDKLMRSEEPSPGDIIVDIRPIGVRETIDICVPPYHNFIANGIVSHNSQKILGTEGHWEVLNEGDSDVEGDMLSAKDQLIRLYPTPKGAFPVVVLYIPVVNHFRSPQARMLVYDMMLAEARIAVGSARRKITGMPTPDGGSINYDGSDLIQEGETAKEKLLEQAINLGEPLGVHMW